MKKLLLIIMAAAVFLFTGTFTEEYSYNTYAASMPENNIKGPLHTEGDKVYDADGNYIGQKAESLDVFSGQGENSVTNKAKAEGRFMIAVIIMLGVIGCITSIGLIISGTKRAKCPYCKKSIPKNSLICPKCGSYLGNR